MLYWSDAIKLHSRDFDRKIQWFWSHFGFIMVHKLVFWIPFSILGEHTMQSKYSLQISKSSFNSYYLIPKKTISEHAMSSWPLFPFSQFRFRSYAAYVYISSRYSYEPLKKFKIGRHRVSRISTRQSLFLSCGLKMCLCIVSLLWRLYSALVVDVLFFVLWLWVV